MPLCGKVIIITGASKGIGRATACLLAERGALVVLAARHRESLQQVAQKIANTNGFSLSIPTDVSSEESVKALITKVVSRFNRVDVLINNAGVCVYGSTTQATLNDWERVMETNLKGVFLCAREVIPVMVRQKAGHIINVASQAGKFGFPHLAIYCASKFGVIGFSESLQQELTPYNVKVSCLCPSYVDTELLKVFPEETITKANIAKPENVADQLFGVIMNPDPKNNNRLVPVKRIMRRIVARWIPLDLV